MKKVLSILMVIIMMLSIIVVPVYAEEQTDEKQNKYFDKFFDACFYDNYYYINHYDYYYDHILTHYYDEIYYHYENETEEEPAWALICCPVNTAPVEVLFGNVVGNRVLHIMGCAATPFDKGYGVYVRETDSFINLSDLEEIVELCPDFVKAIEENEIGQAFGDVDYNGKIDIIDAGYIQRIIAGMRNDYARIDIYFNINNLGGSNGVSIGDFDRDGETTVMDATAIQRHIAGLE